MLRLVVSLGLRLAWVRLFDRVSRIFRAPVLYRIAVVRSVALTGDKKSNRSLR